MITDEQLDAIDQACEFNWAYVAPEIVRALTAEVRRGRKIEEAAQQAKALSRPNSLVEEGFYAIALGELWIALTEETT